MEAGSPAMCSFEESSSQHCFLHLLDENSLPSNYYSNFTTVVLS